MKNRNISVQVIGGIYKGRKLQLPSLDTTRSTKSIIKESLFNTLAFELEGKSFIEVFGGSGSIAIEAVSRGAKFGYAIELDKKAFKILLQNCASIDMDRFICKNGDSFELLLPLVANINEKSIFYFDPPFMYRENMDHIYEKCFKLLENIHKNLIHLAIFEHVSTLKMPNKIGELSLQKSKKFGKSTLSYYG